MWHQWSRVLHIVVRKGLKNMKAGIFLLLIAGCWLGLGLQLIPTILAAFMLYLISGGWRFMIVLIKTLPRDVKALLVLLKLKRAVKRLSQGGIGIPTLFHETCDQHPDKTCFIDVIGDKHWTFRDVDQYSNRVANHFLSQGYRPGDSVAIFMESSAQFVAVWLGLAKIGLVPALINYNLRLDSLAHCVIAADSKALIYSSELGNAVEEANRVMPTSVALFELGASEGESSLDSMLGVASISRPPKIKYDFNSPLIYIYTSGTTGLPKAAKVVHSRYFYMASSLYNFGGMTPSTIVYNTLPLYHTAGGILGVGQALMQGLWAIF